MLTPGVGRWGLDPLGVRIEEGECREVAKWRSDE